jgi:FkbM family methyltransferase
MKLFKYYINPFLKHPLNRGNKLRAIWTFLKWQMLLRHAQSNNSSIIAPYIGGLKIFVKKGLSGITGNLYSELYEFPEMGFLLHFLREDDVFIDVGANVGIYTLLASGIKGAISYSFEPIPSTYGFLKTNAVINNLEKKTFLFNIGVSNESTHLNFSADRDAMNSVVDSEYTGKIERVEVNKLDNLLDGKILASTLIKIDTEGFEGKVLEGAFEILKNNHVKAIIVEMNIPEVINDILVKNSFNPFTYDVFQRALIPANYKSNNNLIYIRDLGYVEKRVRDAEKIKLKKFSI